MSQECEIGDFASTADTPNEPTSGANRVDAYDVQQAVCVGMLGLQVIGALGEAAYVT